MKFSALRDRSAGRSKFYATFSPMRREHVAEHGEKHFSRKCITLCMARSDSNVVDRNRDTLLNRRLFTSLGPLSFLPAVSPLFLFAGFNAHAIFTEASRYRSCLIRISSPAAGYIEWK